MTGDRSMVVPARSLDLLSTCILLAAYVYKDGDVITNGSRFCIYTLKHLQADNQTDQYRIQQWQQ